MSINSRSWKPDVLDRNHRKRTLTSLDVAIAGAAKYLWMKPTSGRHCVQLITLADGLVTA
jgi:hypothetical protein